MSASRCLFPILAACLTLAGGCTKDRARAGGPSCGADGTNTVLIDGTCYCLEGHALAPGGDRCVPDGVGGDGGLTGEDAGPTGEDAGAAGEDAGPPPEGTLRGVGTSHATCAEGCASIGFSCTRGCEGTAGNASYGYYDWDYGWYRSVGSEALATCDATWASSYRHTDGESYDLGDVYCCCEIPAVTRVDGATGETCEQTCARRGFEGCADFHEWPGESASGGTLATYERPETGSVTYVVMGCAATPPAERTIAGARRYLRDWDCACH